jgi:iron complex outermembrane receptor protein
MTRHAARLLLSATALITLPVAAAQAQDTPASAAKGSRTDTPAPGQTTAATTPNVSSDNGDIVVTAQRRSESLQTVPLSVTAVTSAALAERNINDLTQLATAAPSLQIGTDNNFSVRGVGTLAFSGTLDTSVAVSLDDVNLARPQLTGNLFLDVDRVEVLNGPQGLLFGKNASAGLLNIVTARPKTGTWENITDFELSNRDTPSGTGDGAWAMIGRQTVNIPIGDHSALRLNGIYSYQNPPTTFVGRQGARNDLFAEQYGIRGKFLTEFGRLSIYVIGEYFENHGLGGFADRSYRSISPTGLNVAPLAADGIVASPDNFKVAGDGGYFRDTRTAGAQGTINYAFDSGVEISNIASWKYAKSNQQLDTDFTSSNGINVNAGGSTYNQYSDELRLALPAGNRLTGQVGLYYFGLRSNSTGQLAGNNFLPDAVVRGFPFCVGATVVAGPPPACSFRNSAVLGSDSQGSFRNDSYAAFGQGTFTVTDGLKLILGGRVTHDDIAITGVQNQGRYFVTLGSPSSFNAKNGVTNFSWKAGAQYQFTPDIMAYATYGRGYKGPGYNTNQVSTLVPLLVGPETSNNVEAGIKTSFIDRKLVFNLSLFHTRFNNFQVQSFDTVAQTFIVQNAARVTSKGIEVTAIARPLRGLSINEAATILDTKFDDFPGAQCYPGQPVASCATTNTFNARGLRTPVAPVFTSTLLAAYDFATEGFVRPFISGNWYHRSSLNYLINRAPGGGVGTIDTFGANLGVRLANGMELSVFCKNCTNVRYPTFIGLDPGDAASGRLSYQQQFSFDSVRSAGLSVNFRF